MSVRDYYERLQNAMLKPAKELDIDMFTTSSNTITTTTGSSGLQSSASSAGNYIIRETSPPTRMDVSIGKIENGYLVVARGKTYYAESAEAVSAQITALIVAERMESK